MVEDAAVQTLLPATAVKLSKDLRVVKQPAAAERLLRAFVERYPGSFWLNWSLGETLVAQKRPSEAIPYMTAALALRCDGIPDFHEAAKGDPNLDVRLDLGNEWQEFWTKLDGLRKQARADYSETEHKGQLGPKEPEQRHLIKMAAGKTYAIDMASKQFDTYLRLEKVLAENDDISKDNLNSRIVFTAPGDASYRIVATSFQQGGRGVYTLTIRKFAAKKK